MQDSRDYDEEPVVYCAKCYSLKIKYEEAIDADCCMDCGCSDVLTSSIDEWEKLYEQRYGHKFTVKTHDPKKSFIFKLPLEKLKEKVFKDIHWRDIIQNIYPHFPGGLGRADSLILFFDKLTRDNRLDDLRLLLLNHYRNKGNGREEVKKCRG
jgi:hypothetical protein